MTSPRLLALQEMIKALTYGEMIELADGLWQYHKANVGAPLDEPNVLAKKKEDLPPMWHCWATDKLQADEPEEEPKDKVNGAG